MAWMGILGQLPSLDVDEAGTSSCSLMGPP